MRTIAITLAAVFSTASFSTNISRVIDVPLIYRGGVADAAPAPALIEDVQVGVEHVFVPKGFDSNDQLQIMVSGTLPSTCYKRPTGHASIENGVVKIDFYASRDLNRPCLAMPWTFEKEIDLPWLPRGTHHIVLNYDIPDLRKHAEIFVEAPTADSIDNFIYANVKQVDDSMPERKITLKGINPSNCIELDRIESVSNGINTYAILPIMAQTAEECPQVSVPFEYSFTLPDELSSEKIMLHVRSLDGNAVNHIFDNR